MSPVPILAFDRISFGYPSSTHLVLEDFSLGIEPGTVTAVLGPNGAGKTTLLHLALGWLRPRAGVITVAGNPLGSYTRRELGQRLGLVPQSEHTAFEYSLLEFVLLGRAPHLEPLEQPGDDQVDIARQALAQVGLGGLEGRSILGISGGERQLVMVARALAQQPGLLLLDEPTSHLDLGNKARLVGLLRELSARGVTILFTTHEPEVASSVATHLVLVQQGKVLKTGTLPEVFNAADLSRLYHSPVEVREIEGRKVALWS